MALVSVWLLVTTTTALGMVEAVDLFCECQDHRNHSVALHCDETKVGSTDVACRKAAAAAVADIPRGYKFVSGYSVVKLYRTFKQWSAAKQSCEADGSRLAVPPDSYAIDGLKPVFAEEKGIWYAFIGSSEDKNQGVAGANATQKAPEKCSILRSDGVTAEAPCGSVSPYLCERRLSRAVPGTYKWEEDAGRFYKVHGVRAARQQAERTCRADGAALAVADSWLRATVLLRLLEPNLDPYYVGFTDRAVEGDFVTDSGRHLNDMEFQLWAPGEPNGGGDEDCLALSVTGYSDVPCDTKLLFVCEILPL